MGKEAMIWIRADGNAKIGSGHLMRCMTIAKDMDLKQKVCFLTADEESAILVEKNGFDVKVLGEEPYSSGEIIKVKGMLEKENISLLLVDSYQVSDDYLSALKEYAKVALLEDAMEKKRPADLIINYNLFASKEEYRKLYDPGKVTLLVGGEFIPVREAFRQRKYQVRREGKEVLFLTGGGDYYHLAEKFLEFFGARQEWKDTQFHMICGFYRDDNKTLFDMAAKHGNVTLYEHVSSIWELMEKCDLAISAGGTTVYELMCMGVPVVTYSFADNQKPLTDYLQRQSIAEYCGDYRELGEDLFSNMEKALKNQILYEKRIQQFQLEKQLVDGQGALRIAENLQ